MQKITPTHQSNFITTDFHAFSKPHILNRVDPLIKQSITTKRRKTAWPIAGLAQARRLLLYEMSSLAQVADSRLGETTTVALGEFAGARWGEAISPERDGFSLKKSVHSLERVLTQYSWASFCNSRLGEMSSPGWEHQFAISYFTWQRHTPIPNDNQFILISRQAFQAQQS